MKKLYKESIFKHPNIIVAIIFIIALSFITIGYASYEQLTPINGTIHIVKAGDVEITDITLVSSSNVQSSTTPSFNKKNAVFNIVFGGTDSTNQAVYQVTIKNNSVYDYAYSGFNYNPTITSSSGTGIGTLNTKTTGISNGDIISPGDSKVLTVTLDLTVTDSNTSYNTNIDANITGSTNNTGNIIGSITPTTGDLSGTKTLAPFTTEIINTYNYAREFTLSSSNSNFLVVNSSGTEISSLTIPANTTQNYTFYLKAKSSAIFLTNSETTTITLGGNNITNTNIGSINLKVDIYVAPDTTIPTVGSASLKILDTSGSFTASWNRIDEGGSSITNYTILLYNTSGTLVQTANTNSSNTTYTFTNKSAGTYYIIVYGTDASGNTGSSYTSSATTNNGYATKSSSVAMQWTFSVTKSISGMSFSGSSTALLHQPYSGTFIANNNYTIPTSITVSMGGSTLSSGSDYSYSSSSGAFSIPSVTGNITISGSATKNICLVKGTKILLANGKYKNIEDIRYGDLLLVYSYELGKFVYEYPSWIEKEGTRNSYQLTTFSDGTTLSTAGFHGIFSYDLNRFVSVDNKEEFHIGTTVAKINNTKTGFIKVKVVSIKMINKKISYYHVVSTRYYNIIANNLLTTDGTVILSNLYGFNKNITWPQTRLKIINNSNNLYKYDDFKDLIPYYMFLSLRIEEAKYLSNFGLSKDIFKYYLSKNQVNSEMLLLPIQKNDSNMWMVTTSDDNVNELNKANYLIKEGTTYLLKLPKNLNNFIGWYNSSDNKIYYPGNNVNIYMGTYFKALYK